MDVLGTNLEWALCSVLSLKGNRGASRKKGSNVTLEVTLARAELSSPQVVV